MNVIGVVGEFNPLHLGHVEHFKKSRNLLGEDAPIVCVMSGDFVQRGEAACFDKHTRARAAAAAGADLVFELPLPWCLASAERFALGAVGLLDALGVVSHLSFGSETGDLATLEALARAAASPEALTRIRRRMGEGISFAAAREDALRRMLGDAADLLRRPNCILGVEYLKALTALGSGITPMTTLRAESEHDGLSEGTIRSAGQLRAMLAMGEDVSAYVPEAMGALMAAETAAGRGPMTMARLDTAVMARLRALGPEALDALPDAAEGLGNRFYKALRSEGTLRDVLAAVKTKRYPLSRLRRMALCAALGLRSDTGGAVPPYARLLASTERGRAILRQAKSCILTKPAAVKRMGGEALRIFSLTANARDFYVLGYASPQARRGGSDWRTGPAVL